MRILFETPPGYPRLGHRDTTGTPQGHHRDTTGTLPGHRDTTGTPPGHHRDTTGTPPGHHRDTTGTRAGPRGGAAEQQEQEQQEDTGPAQGPGNQDDSRTASHARHARHEHGTRFPGFGEDHKGSHSPNLRYIYINIIICLGEIERYRESKSNRR